MYICLGFINCRSMLAEDEDETMMELSKSESTLHDQGTIHLSSYSIKTLHSR
jgi:hypothetical protein